MKLSGLLSSLALSASAVTARRSLQHVGHVADRLGQRQKAPVKEPRSTPEYAEKSTNASWHYLTDKTKGEPGILGFIPPDWGPAKN